MKEKISKAAMKRLLKSKFFEEVLEVVKAWDYYLVVGDKEAADEMMHKWFMAKLALEFITGNSYSVEFSRKRETYSIVNEQNYNDRLFTGLSFVQKEESMKGIWKPMCNPIDTVDGLKDFYIAHRVLDTSEVWHAGNIETSGEYTADRESVVKLCEALNKQGGEKNE